METNNGIAEKKDSKRVAMNKSGVLHEQYTLDSYFVKIYPAYAISKVRCSFVQKGSNGTKSFDVYVDLDTFYSWMEDINLPTGFGRFEQILASEKAAGLTSPKHYSYRTGENGALLCGIGASTTGYAVFHGEGYFKGNPKRQYANVPVDEWWLRALARWTLASAKSVYEEGSKVLAEASERFHYTDEEITSEEYMETLNTDSEVTASHSDTTAPASGVTVPVLTNQPKEVHKDAERTTTAVETERICFIKHDKPLETGGVFICPIRQQKLDGGYSKAAMDLTIYASKFPEGSNSYENIKLLLTTEKERLGPVKGTVCRQNGNLILLSIDEPIAVS